jgi:predicted membrane protein
MKKLLKGLFSDLKGKPNSIYCFVWFIFFELCGIGFVLFASFKTYGFVLGLILGLFVLAVGTLTLLLLPLLFAAVGLIIRLGSVLAFPFYILTVIAQLFFGEKTFLLEYGYLYPLLISLALSLFGYLNIITLIKAKKENPGKDLIYLGPF